MAAEVAALRRAVHGDDRLGIEILIQPSLYESGGWRSRRFVVVSYLLL